MRQLLGPQKRRLSYAASHHKAATQTTSHPGPLSDGRVIVVPSRPQVTVLPSSDPYEQLPSLFISSLALLIALYSLKRNLAQKRDEHRAKFFHEVVVNQSLLPLLRFFEHLQGFSERQSAKLINLASTPGHDSRVRAAMRKVREMKRSAAARICGLVSPFSTDLERQLQSILDEAADAANRYLEINASDAANRYVEIYASGSTAPEPLSHALAACQRTAIELLREHEFGLGWPRFWDSLRRRWSRLLGRN
jgi:hypothetical protein